MEKFRTQSLGILLLIVKARERDALLFREHPQREETDAFPSSPTAFPFKYVSPVKTHLFCRHLWNIHNAPTIQPSAREMVKTTPAFKESES